MQEVQQRHDINKCWRERVELRFQKMDEGRNGRQSFSFLTHNLSLPFSFSFILLFSLFVFFIFHPWPSIPFFPSCVPPVIRFFVLVIRLNYSPVNLEREKRKKKNNWRNEEKERNKERGRKWDRMRMKVDQKEQNNLCVLMTGTYLLLPLLSLGSFSSSTFFLSLSFPFILPFHLHFIHYFLFPSFLYKRIDEHKNREHCDRTGTGGRTRTRKELEKNQKRTKKWDEIKEANLLLLMRRRFLASEKE